MTTERLISDSNEPVILTEHRPTDFIPLPYHSVESNQLSMIMNEVINSAKDERINVKRALSADIASTARVQNQNERVLAAYERELQREGLSQERQDEILKTMRTIAESTVHENAASREFQKEQLNNSHKRLLEFMGGAIIFVLVGSTLLIRTKS